MNDYKALMKEGQEDEAIKVLADNRDRLTVLAPMAMAAKGVSGMNKAIDSIVMDKKKTPVQKRKEINKLLGERNESAREGVTESRNNSWLKVIVNDSE